MQSGIPDSLDHDFLQEYYADPTMQLTPDESIARAAARADEFKPAGQDTFYNNLNHHLLQRIVQKVTGRSLGTQIRSAILRPLGLTHTSYPTGDILPGPLRGGLASTRPATWSTRRCSTPASPAARGR